MSPAPLPLDVAASAHVVVDDLDQLVLADRDAHHLSASLRLRAGEAVTATDGTGRWRLCAWDGTGLEGDGDVQHVVDAGPAVAVAFAPPKGDRPGLIVRMLTELGMARIIVLETDRGVVHWHGDRARERVERLRRIAREAIMQSRQATMPDVEGPVPFLELVRNPGAVVADRGGGPLVPTARCVLVGPEGGWSDRERAAIGVAVGLGDAVLRTETAAVAGGSALRRHAV